MWAQDKHEKLITFNKISIIMWNYNGLFHYPSGSHDMKIFHPKKIESNSSFTLLHKGLLIKLTKFILYICMYIKLPSIKLFLD